MGCAALASQPAGPGQPPPPPARAVGRAPATWGKPNCQNSNSLQSHLGGRVSSHLCLLCASGVLRATSPTESPDKASGRALSSRLELRAWPVSIYCLQMCRPLGQLACHLCPQALSATLPGQALPGSSQDKWDQVHTVGSHLLCLPPLPGLRVASARLRPQQAEVPVPASPLTGK